MKTPEPMRGTLPNTDQPRIPRSEYLDTLYWLITDGDATVTCGRHSPPYSAQTSTEGLVCDRGDESGVERTMAG